MAAAPRRAEPAGEPGRSPGRLPSVRNVGEWRRAARRFLEDRGFESSRAEADFIAARVLEMKPADLVLARDRILSLQEKRRLSRILHRRARRIPLQYLLGDVEFHGITLRVRPGVFIPRPETEGLVARVLGFLPPAAPGAVVDVGTGTGAVALAVAAERPRIRVTGTDISTVAVRLARENARRLGLDGRSRFLRKDLIRTLAPSDLGEGLRVVVSNPPYISLSRKPELDPEVVDHEPPEALFAGEDGMTVIRDLEPLAAELLGPGGLFALEIGDDQREAVTRLLTRSGRWFSIRVETDLAGKDRYALALRAGPETGRASDG